MTDRRLPILALAGLALAAIGGGAPGIAAGQISPAPSAATVPQAEEKAPQPPAGTPRWGMSGSSTAPGEEGTGRSGGVIIPPAAGDSEIAKPPPAIAPRSTPVIRPPGTPGGNPEINPK